MVDHVSRQNFLNHKICYFYNYTHSFYDNPLALKLKKHDTKRLTEGFAERGDFDLRVIRQLI